MTTPTQQDLAEACSEAMWRDDRASQGLGITLDHVAPGEAILSMTVLDSMVNGHATCHGGFIFALADSAFAFACNTYDQRTVAQQASIAFLAPATVGARLTARAREVSRRGRSGLYDVTVVNESGETIAEFRGHSRTVKGRLLPEQA